jgi:CheY-like chemotaxis protein
MDPTILVVEDDPQVREVIADVLSDEGYAVQEAPDGQGALEQIEAKTPDLILSDVWMPRLTGLELAERLSRRRDPVPIVLMSADNNAPPVGSTMFLAKPFAIDELIALIDRVLGKKRRPRLAAPGPGDS